MQEIGAALRAARERQEKSLDEVYRATHITTRYLTDLENGAFEEIPGEVYLKGFLRRYAQYLGLDGEEIVGQYVARRAAEQQASTPEESRPKRAAAKPRPHPSRPAGAGRIVVAVAALALAAVATGWALAIWSVRTPATPPAPREAATPVTPPASSAAPEAPATAPTAAPPADQAAAPAETPPAPGEAASGAAPVRVAVKLTERCWLRVTADGKLVYQGELEPGAESSWTAQERLTVRIGNPPGIQVVWNGKVFPVPGKDPVTQVFTPDSSFGAGSPGSKPASAAQTTGATPAAPGVTPSGNN